MALVDKIAVLKSALEVIVKIANIMHKCVEFIIDAVEK